MVKNRLKRGNSKLDKSILCWSITPVKSCLNCSQCKDKCYAMKPYKMRKNVRISWDYNFSIAKDGSFVKRVIGQIERSRTVKSVRIHVAGDFFSSEYINNWITIVKTFPKIKFYTYTKVWHIFKDELDALSSLKNCNIINSIASDGGINFGDDNRISELKNLGYKVCPALTKKNIKCGKTCSLCITNELVCFPIH